MEWLGVDRRRLGTGLLAFGLAGLVIAGLVAVGLLAGALAARSLDERVAANQARLVAALDRVDATIARTVTTIENAGATLGTTSETLGSAEAVLGEIAGAADELSTSLDFTVLGSRPLAGAARRFGELSVQVRGFEDKAGALAENLAVNSGDTRALATQVETLRGDVRDVADRVAAFDSGGELAALIAIGVLLLALLAAWLAVAGAACAWAGLRLRRLAAAPVEVVTIAVPPDSPR